MVKRGLPLPFKGLDRRDLIAVGEGGEACYVYLAQAKSGKGRLLMDFGLDSSKYVRDPETMENGWYTLTVPSAKLTPGCPATLRVVAKVNATRRWFAVAGE